MSMDDENKYLVRIGDEFGCGLDMLKGTLDACPELSIQDNGSDVNKYVQYKSETNKTITVLSEKSCIGSVVESSNVIIYFGDEIDGSQYKDYTPVELVNPIKPGERNENFLKYVFQVLSDLCDAGLMQGFERIIKASKLPDMNESNSDTRNDEQRISDNKEKALKDQKYIICDYGDAETGKSTTLKKVIALLELSKNTVRRDAIEQIPDGNNTHGMDLYAKYEVNGVKIAVCTQGDPVSELPRKLEDAILKGMDVIVCAARDDRNGAMNAKTVLQVYSPNISALPQGSIDYVKIWTRNFFISQTETNINKQNIDILSKNMTNIAAVGIVELIEQLKGVKIL